MIGSIVLTILYIFKVSIAWVLVITSAIGIGIITHREFLGTLPLRSDDLVHVTVYSHSLERNVFIATFSVSSLILDIQRGIMKHHVRHDFELRFEELKGHVRYFSVLDDHTTLSQIIQRKTIHKEPDGSYNLMLFYIPA